LKKSLFSNLSWIFAFMLLVLGTSCTKQPGAHFHWEGLENQALTRLGGTEERGEQSSKFNYESQDLLLRLQLLEKGDFEKLNSRIALFVATPYEPVFSPYPGSISQQIACPKVFWPKRFEQTAPGMKKAGFYFQTNARSVVGICSEQDLSHEMAHFALKCGKRIYEIKVTVPKNSVRKIKEIVEGFSCEK
jgi:hypothetical protein